MRPRLPRVAGLTGVEGGDFVRRELGDAVAVGFEVVDEEDVFDAESDFSSRSRASRVPRKVGELEAAVADGAGAAEAGGGDVRGFLVAFGEKLMHDVVERGEVFGGEFFLTQGNELAGGEVVERKMDLGAADVACEDHVLLQS